MDSARSYHASKTSVRRFEITDYQAGLTDVSTKGQKTPNGEDCRINRYAMELAARFHRFYNACRIKGAEPGVLEARLLLADCVRSAIAVCLGILGVHAPEQM